MWRPLGGGAGDLLKPCAKDADLSPTDFQRLSVEDRLIAVRHEGHPVSRGQDVTTTRQRFASVPTPGCPINGNAITRNTNDGPSVPA